MNVFIGIFGFIYKLYIALVFIISMLLYYLPILILKQKESTKKATFKVFLMWSWTVRIFAFVHVKFIRKVSLPKGPYIIISNHASYFDIFLMYSIFPQHEFLFLGKSEILNYPLVKTFFKDLNIPVYRKDRLKAAKSFVTAKKSVSNGWSLVIFPEGGIPDDNLPNMKEFKDGAFKLAKAANVPLVPVSFLNNYKLFSDPDKLLGEAHPGISKVYQHDIIYPEKIEHLSVDELKEYCFNLIASKL